MMEFVIVKKQEVEIDEKRLAKDLSECFYDALAYQDCDFAKDIESGDYEIQRLAMLNRIGEVWHEEFLKEIVDKRITSEKEIFR